jgi:exodeoxyribonuclease V beta subunit
MEFTLPVVGAGAARFTAASLADVLAEHAQAPGVCSYAERVRSLGFARLQGHLRGFVDLVFEHGGRFYLVDYKSNHLGEAVGDYQADSLEQAMHAHHYTLQYHLYVVALHRYLRQRLSDYDYARHMGGVYYLFLRGMAPGHEPGTGIHFDRPPAELIGALSALLAGETSDEESAA